MDFNIFRLVRSAEMGWRERWRNKISRGVLQHRRRLVLCRLSFHTNLCLTFVRFSPLIFSGVFAEETPRNQMKFLPRQLFALLAHTLSVQENAENAMEMREKCVVIASKLGQRTTMKP